jgi:lipoprotein-anchoring transpeptidase ErfK/SrfK
MAAAGNAQAIPAAQMKAAAAIHSNEALWSQRTILVSLPDHKLAVLEAGEVKAIYSVAIGKATTPSPIGRFTIVSHVAYPTYSHKGRVVGPGPHNPVGTRWMGLSQKGYGIHGTNVPSSIGKPASHGCIRVGQKDLEELFRMVQVGDAVDIRGQRDAEVTAVFGSEPQQPAAPTAGVLVTRTSAPVALSPMQTTSQQGE